MALTLPAPTASAQSTATPPTPSLVRRFVRGRRDDPAWVRPALLALLALTALAYIVDLSASGWANAFYSAAVEAGTKSWKAFFFGSFDSSNFITVDKPPAALWVMELSARLFGLSSWSLLVPEALEGVASVALCYLCVRRWFSPAAALLAGAVLAITPVAALMFRFNNPDALLVLLLCGAAYATTRAIEDGRTRWLLLAGALIGTGFLTKMLQAFLVVPALAGAYLLAGRPALGRRIVQLLAGATAMLVAAGWWVAVVELVPKADRPYVGGSQNDSVLNLIFGYNGFGRLSGNENGSVGTNWGPTGWDRLFLPTFGSQISWLLPAALLLLVGLVVLRRRRARTDRLQAALVLWGGWLLVTGVVFSWSKGIIHPYYSVALAPAIAVIVGIGASTLWRSRARLLARVLLAIAVGVTAIWSFILLGRSPSFLAPVRFVVLALGLASAVAFVCAPAMSRRRLRLLLAMCALTACLGGPLLETIDTVVTAHSGSIPSAGPTVVDASGGPGGGAFPGGAAGGFPGRGGTQPGAGGRSATRPGALPTGGPAPGGANHGGGAVGTGRAGGRASGVAGGLLESSTPGKALVRALEGNAHRYRWVAATIGANSAAGYQLATDDPVMAIGGFNGTDPSPTLAAFEADAAAGRIHYFLTGGAGTGTSGDATKITSWVERNFTAQVIDGVTLYNLSVQRG